MSLWGVMVTGRLTAIQVMINININYWKYWKLYIIINYKLKIYPPPPSSFISEVYPSGAYGLTFSCACFLCIWPLNRAYFMELLSASYNLIMKMYEFLPKYQPDYCTAFSHVSLLSKSILWVSSSVSTWSHLKNSK